MLALLLFSLSFVAMMFGVVLHFWILAKLEGAGVDVKYFATLIDSFGAYKTYRLLATQKAWATWPLYMTVIAGYGGLLGACVSLLLSPSLLHWLGRPVK